MSFLNFLTMCSFILKNFLLLMKSSDFKKKYHKNKFSGTFIEAIFEILIVFRVGIAYFFFNENDKNNVMVDIMCW